MSRCAWPKNKHLAQPIAWRRDYMYCKYCQCWTIPSVSFTEVEPQ